LAVAKPAVGVHSCDGVAGDGDQRSWWRGETGLSACGRALPSPSAPPSPASGRRTRLPPQRHLYARSLCSPDRHITPGFGFAYPRPVQRVYSPPHRSPHYRGAPTKRRGGRGGWGDGRITPGPAFGSRGGGAGGEAHRASPQSGQHTVHLPSRL